MSYKDIRLDEISATNIVKIVNSWEKPSAGEVEKDSDSDAEAIALMKSKKGPPVPFKHPRDDGGDVSDAEHSSSTDEASEGEDEPPMHEASDDGDDDGPPPPPPPYVPTHLDPACEIKPIRNGKSIFYGGIHVGTVTAWSRGISTKCMLHRAKCCNLPLANGVCSTDVVLIDWLLCALKSDGTVAKSELEHTVAKPAF